MSKIKFTTICEIETEHFLDAEKAWSLIKAANEGAEANLDDMSVLTIIGVVDAKMETELKPINIEETTDEDGVYLP